MKEETLSAVRTVRVRGETIETIEMSHDSARGSICQFVMVVVRLKSKKLVSLTTQKNVKFSAFSVHFDSS